MSKLRTNHEILYLSASYDLLRGHVLLEGQAVADQVLAEQQLLGGQFRTTTKVQTHHIVVAAAEGCDRLRSDRKA